MPLLENEAEMDAYYLAGSSQPRAAAVMWHAIIERRIDRLFKIGLRKDSAVHDTLFQPTGPLGSYAAKVRLAYMLGWVGQDFYEDLLTVAKIRNRFAHSIECKSFSDQPIADWIKRLRGYQLLPRMLEDYKERAKSDKSVMTYLSITRDAIEDLQLGFRWCIDTMLHQLNSCAANMEKNLSSHAPDWTVRPPSKGARVPSEVMPPSEET